MICFERTLPNHKLIAFIEDSFYSKYKLIFDSMFSTFNMGKISEKLKDSIYIYECDECFFEKMDIQYVAGCNTSDKTEWVHHLRISLEEWLNEVLKCTILHGSSINLFGKNFLFLGERKSGKTTLTNFLIHKKEAVYLDDDCFYIIDDGYYGFNLPLYLRGVNEGNQYIIGHTIDYDETYRTVIIPTTTKQSISKIDYIIFPKYNNEKNNSIVKIARSEVFEKVIKNVKHSADLQLLFHDINQLLRETDVFNISYENSQVAYEQLLFIASR